MYLIVGLGNPGKQYDKTRHNVGFDLIDMLADDLGISVNKIKFKSLIGEGRIRNEKVILMKPQTYMNLSGDALREIYAFYKDLKPENIIVAYDDIDFDIGVTKIRKKGSAGTHNGMKSIIYNLQFDTFPRIRIGVGKPPHKSYDLADYVLGRFSTEERKIVDDMLKRNCDAVKAIVEDGVDKAMNQFNG